VSDLVVWYAVRASGLVAFALLTVSVLVGLTMSGRKRFARWPRFAVEDLHGYAGVLAGIFVVLHGFALWIDGYLPFTFVQLVVPGTSSYRPLAVAAGVVSAELLAALALTNRFRRALPHRLWRRAHYANFAVWGLALVHGIAAGTDAHDGWAIALYAATSGAVGGATLRRVLGSRALESWQLKLWPSTAAIVAAELVVAVSLVPR
jgi:methionine sulfoxide reductase heme-binding subunit